MDLRRPPAGFRPAQILEEWLPQAFVAAGCAALPDAPRVRITLSGSQGGDWLVATETSGVAVRPLAAAEGEAAKDRARCPVPGAGVWLRQSDVDFTATLIKDPDLPELLPVGWTPLDFLFLDPRDVELVRQIDGRLAVELTGQRRRRWVLDLAIGKNGLGAGRPRATVKVAASTYDDLKAGRMPPLRALLERKITVEGDRALAMQGLLLLGTRLAR